MIEIEAREFVKKVLQGEWPNWNPTDWQLKTWLMVLVEYEYEPSLRAVRDYSITVEKRYKEPNIVTIKQILLAVKIKIEGVRKNEPVKLFTLVRESNIGKRYGLDYYAPTSEEIPSEHEIENQAAVAQREANSLYRENHIIVYSAKAQRKEQ